jgi:DNA primase
MLRVRSVSDDELMSICPFHNDTKPSLGINIGEKGIYHCFSCGATGRTTELVEKFGGFLLEDSDGIVYSSSMTVSYEEDNVGFEYLRKRGFQDSTIQEFSICYDSESSRVVIPVISRNGVVSGTIGRTVVGDEPKYKYSAGFKASQHLFGMNKYQPAKYLYLVEGSLDSIWMWQNGYKSTLSILGSNLSDTQAAGVKYLSNRVVLCFDTDKAGQDCIRESAEKLMGLGVVTWAIRLPEGKKDVQDCSLGELLSVVEGRIPTMLYNFKHE